MKKYVPTYEGTLRKHALTVPHCISKCSGIRVFGRRIKSLVFSTDVAIIKNINADAVIAVYPFTPQAGITQAIIGVSDVPVFVGVGGGLTKGQRSAHIAAFAEHQGAFGVVCNTFIDDDTIRAIKATVEIPVVYTVVSEKVDLESKLAAGIDFVNVSGADRTPAIVAGNPGPLSGAARYRHRRSHGGDDPVHHCRRGQRHHLHTAQQRAAVRQGYAPLPGVVRPHRRPGGRERLRGNVRR